MNLARLFFVLSLAISSYFAYTAVSGAIRSHRIGQEEAAAAERVEALREDRTYLQAVLRYVASDAYVEQEARRRLGYVRGGEIPVVITGPTLGAQPARGGDWWERLFPR